LNLRHALHRAFDDLKGSRDRASREALPREIERERFRVADIVPSAVFANDQLIQGNLVRSDLTRTIAWLMRGATWFVTAKTISIDGCTVTL
jgi:hypothetical protein